MLRNTFGNILHKNYQNWVWNRFCSIKWLYERKRRPWKRRGTIRKEIEETMDKKFDFARFYKPEYFDHSLKTRRASGTSALSEIRYVYITMAIKTMHAKFQELTLRRVLTQTPTSHKQNMMCRRKWWVVFFNVYILRQRPSMMLTY